jgi:antitoxin MazE
MKAKVAKWGNSLAVRLPKGLAEELGVRPGSTVELEKDGTRLMIETSPAGTIPRYRLEDLLAQIKPGAKPPQLDDWSAVETSWPDDDWSDIAPTDEQMGLSNAGRRRKRS